MNEKTFSYLSRPGSLAANLCSSWGMAILCTGQVWTGNAAKDWCCSAQVIEYNILRIWTWRFHFWLNWSEVILPQRFRAVLYMDVFGVLKHNRWQEGTMLATTLCCRRNSWRLTLYLYPGWDSKTQFDPLASLAHSSLVPSDSRQIAGGTVWRESTELAWIYKTI